MCVCVRVLLEMRVTICEWVAGRVCLCARVCLNTRVQCERARKCARVHAHTSVSRAWP